MSEERYAELRLRLPERLVTTQAPNGEQRTIPDYKLPQERIFLGYGVKNHNTLFEIAKLLPIDPGVYLIDPQEYHLTVLNIENPYALLEAAIKSNPDINLAEFVWRLDELSKPDVAQRGKLGYEITAWGNKISVYGDSPSLYLALELMPTSDVMDLHRPFQMGLKHLLEDFKIEHIKEIDPRIGRQFDWRPHISFAKVCHEALTRRLIASDIVNTGHLIPLFLSPLWEKPTYNAQNIVSQLVSDEALKFQEASPTNGMI